jgi:uncharacterized protein YndB with AHSA1/START domain
MWKWILGAVVLIVLLIGSGMWYGLRKMSALASGDSTATLTIGATPDRVFASLANGDSIGDWMVSGRVRPSRNGLLRRGDTLYVEQRDSARAGRMAWVVTDVSPGKAFSLQLEGDSLNIAAISRRYTILAQGDSAVVFSTVTSPMMDSVRRVEAGGSNSSMMAFASKMMLGAMRMQNGLELKQLKARIEGTAPPVPETARP